MVMYDMLTPQSTCSETLKKMSTSDASGLSGLGYSYRHRHRSESLRLYYDYRLTIAVSSNGDDIGFGYQSRYMSMVLAELAYLVLILATLPRATIHGHTSV